MGNPNQRSRAATPSSTAKRIQQPAIQAKRVEAKSVHCTKDTCPVLNYHIDKVYNASNHDVPEIIKIKHTALNETIAARKFQEARAIRRFLERFYAHHGPADGSALLALPDIPEKPKQCRNPNCPVKKYHHEKGFEADSEDLPFIVKDYQKRFGEALKERDYKLAVISRGFLERFFLVHGPSVLETLPALFGRPERCQNQLCPVPTSHTDKVYGQHARDLPRVVKHWMTRTWEIDSRMGDWEGSREQQLLNEFWLVHGESGKDTPIA